MPRRRLSERQVSRAGHGALEPVAQHVAVSLRMVCCGLCVPCLACTWALAEHDVLTAQTEEFGGAQPGLHGKQQQGSIATPAPVSRLGAAVERPLRRAREIDRSPWIALARHGETRCARALCSGACSATYRKKSGWRRGGRCDCGRYCRVPVRDDRGRRRGTECPDRAASGPRALCQAVVALLQQQTEGIPVAGESVGLTCRCRTRRSMKNASSRVGNGLAAFMAKPPLGWLHAKKRLSQQLWRRREIQ